MNLDLNTLLEGWPHEPGQIRVRRIRGIDGKEKIQLRLDLGLIQMEVDGRPDGTRPKGAESLLQWHRKRALEAEAEGERYPLSPDECGDLQQESVQYYHRYLALFQLEDFKGVVRDTQHNLDLFSFVSAHADREDVAWTFEQFRPYVLMMNIRAKASMELEKGKINGAIELIEQSREAILKMLRERPEPKETSPEVQFLTEWLEELRGKRPLSKLELMQKEMDQAIATEAYERAAELRDAIHALTQKSVKPAAKKAAKAPEPGTEPSASTAAASKKKSPAKTPKPPAKAPRKPATKSAQKRPSKSASKPAKAPKPTPKSAAPKPASKAVSPAKRVRKKKPASE